MFANPISSGSAGSVRLPAINSDRSMISARSSSAQDRSAWASEIRKRINDCLKKGDDVEDEADDLKKELIKLFIAAIQSDKKEHWRLVIEGLEACLPLKEILQGDDMIFHYIERLYFHHSAQNRRFGGYDVCGWLERVFPQETRSVATRRRRRFPISRAHHFDTTPREVTTSTLAFKTDPRTEDDLFNKPLPAQPISAPKNLTMGDLASSLPHVVAMSSRYESTWAKPTGETFKALGIDFSVYQPEDVKRLKQIEEEVREEEMSVADDSCSILGSETVVEAPDQTPLDGRQAVEYFYKLFHLGKVRVMFFNVRKQRRFNPYDLKVVPKALVNPEHYIFSTFGVLYVSDHGPGEIMSLSDWQRESVLYKAISQIPFFRNFLLQKLMNRWKENIHTIKFLKRKKHLSQILVTNVSVFCKSLLQLMKLLDELRTLKLLPFDNSKRYSIGDFENDANYKSIQVDEVIEKFHGYVQFIVNETAAELLKKLKYCQEQVHHKTVFTKDSLHLQKLKREVRQKALDDARREASQLGNFVRYVDQLVASQFVEITLSNVCSYVYDILSNTESQDEATTATRLAVFETNLAISPEQQLSLEPSLETFQDSLIAAIRRIPALLTKHAIPLDGLLLESYIPRLNQISESFSGAPDSARRHEKSTTERKSIMTNADLLKNIGVKHFTPPDTPRERLPTKREDNLRVATPEYVPKMLNVQEELQVVGEGFVGQYSPLVVTNIVNILHDNVLYDKSLEHLRNLFDEAEEDILQFYDDYQWLYEIQEHCQSWTDASVKSWKNAQAYVIEQKLNSLRAWTDRVKTMDQYYVTTNKLIFINCQNLQESLILQLSNSYRQLVNFVVSEALDIGRQFVQEMREILKSSIFLDVKNLQNKSTSVEIFAQFSTGVQKYRGDIVRYQETAEYFKTLLEVIRVSYRQLTTEEERLEEQVQTAWDAFLVQIQDAAEFVSQQRQIVIKYLEDTFEKLEREGKEIIDYLLSERFRDPTRKPLEVLLDIRHKRDELYNIHNQLQSLSRYREMIIGSPFDLKSMKAKTSAIDSRQDLWKFMEVASHAIKDWKNLFFRKFNVASAIEKVTEWQHAGVGFESQFSPDDPVLTEYQRLLSDFKQNLPFMAKLASPALKSRHWHTLLVGFNSAFETHVNLKVIDVIGMDLQRFDKLISSVYEGALSEYKIEQRFLSLRKIWHEKAFKIGKYIPSRTALRQVEVDKQLRVRAQTPTQARRRPRMEEFENRSKEKPEGDGFRQPRDIFVLMDVDDFFHSVHDAIAELDNIMKSPFVHDLLLDVKSLHASLSEVFQVVEQLHFCQQKWLFLKRMFEQPSPGPVVDEERDNFAPFDRQFVEIMQSVTEHPQVLLIASQERGSPKFRILQGWHLLGVLMKLTSELRQIIARMRSLFNTFRRNFHRLNFLSDDELVELLGISRDPQNLLPFVQRFFPGVREVLFKLPDDQLGARSIDVALNSSKLVTAGFKGSFGDEVEFQEPVPQLMTPTSWLVDFEQRLKTSQYRCLRSCVRLRIDGVDPLDLLRSQLDLELTPETKERLEKSKDHSGQVLTAPISLQIVAEKVMFAMEVRKALESGQQETVESLRQAVAKRLTDVASALNAAFSKRNLDVKARERLILICQRLTLCLREHLDNLEALLTAPSSNERSFEWLRVLHYSMHILPSYTIVVETITPPAEEDEEEERHPSRRGPAANRRRSSRRRPAVSLGLIEEKAPKVVRRRAVVKEIHDIREVRAMQMGMAHDFDYEYVCGEDASIVWTPLTERCVLSVTQALRHFHLGALVGAPGSGKSETLRCLGRSLARHTQPIVCAEDLGMDVLKSYAVGALLNGSLLVLEHLNDLSPLVLSSLSEMLFYLKFALTSVASKTAQPKTKTPTRRIRRNSGTTGSERAGEGNTGRRRRHSVSKEIDINSKDYFVEENPYVDMFYDHMLVRFGKDIEIPHRSDKQSNYYVPRHFGNILFGGELLNARTTFGTVCTVNYGRGAKLSIPESLKVIYRPCAVLLQSLAHVLRGLLLAHGFSFVDELQQKLLRLRDLLNADLGELQLSLRHLRSVVQVAGMKLQSRRGAPQSASVLGSVSEASSGCGTPRSVSSTVSSLFDDDLVREEEAVVVGLCEVLPPILQSPSVSESFNRILRSVFSVSAHSAHLRQQETALRTMAKEQLQRNGYSARPAVLDKIAQLHASVFTSRATLICGLPGSGKTVLIDTLLRALSHLPTTPMGPGSARSGTERRVERISIHLDAFTLADVFGASVGANDLDQTELGLLGSVLAHRQRRSPHEGDGLTCVHLDGQINGPSCVKLNCLLSRPGAMTLTSGHYVRCHESCRFVIETCDLRNMEPRILAHLSIVHVNKTMLDWRQIWQSWLQDAKMKFIITEGGRVILTDVVQSFVPKLEKFSTEFPLHAIYENIGQKQDELQMQFHVVFGQFIRILDSLLTKYFLRDHWEGEDTMILRQAQTGKSEHCLPTNWMRIEDNIDLYYALLESLFVYSLIWSVGCSVPDAKKRDFEALFREILNSRPIQVELSDDDSVFDLMVDMKSGAMVQWSDKHVEKLRTKTSIVASRETERIKYIATLLLNSKHPVLMFGAPGVGKSAMLDQFVNKVYQSTKFHMSPKITARLLQGAISSEHHHYLARLAASPDHVRAAKQASQQLVFCLDDLHLSITESQTGKPLEVVRQIIRDKGTYHHKRFAWENYPHVTFAASCATFGSIGTGTSSMDFPMSARSLRLFSLIHVFKPSESTMENIFSTLLSSWISDFPKNSVDHTPFMTKMISRSLIAAYSRISEEFRATPSTPHYAFTFHQLFQTVRGLYLLAPRNVTRLLHSRSKIKSGRSDISELSRHSQQFPRLQDLCPLTIPVIRVWYHELLRTFQDRMESNRDKSRCESILVEVIGQHFCEAISNSSKEGLMSAIQEESVASKSEHIEDDENLDFENVDSPSIYQSMHEYQGDESRSEAVAQSIPSSKPGSSKELHQVTNEKTSHDGMGHSKESMAESETDVETNDGSETTTTQVTTSTSTMIHFYGGPGANYWNAMGHGRSHGAGRPIVGNLSSGAPRKGKRGVSFKPNVYDGSDQFVGPLVASVDQILPGPDSSSEIIYVTKNFVSFAEDWSMDKNYVEINRDEMLQCLESALASFNKVMGHNVDVVFLWTLMQQVARISRSIAFVAGNAILLSKANKVGRSSLTKLAAHMEHCKYFQLSDDFSDWGETLKAASLNAGLQNRGTVLFVKWLGNDDLFQAICQIVREGLCPGLFTDDDKLNILHNLAPNIAQSGKYEKIEQVVRSFANSVKDNLHFVISADGDSRILNEMLSRYPVLLSLSTAVTFFEDWTFDSSYVIAKHWLSDHRVHDFVHWDEDHVHEQIHFASEMLAFCHMEAGKMETEYAPASDSSSALCPTDMKRCISVYKTLAQAIRQNETINLQRYSEAVNRIEDVNSRMADYETHLDEMRPRIQKHRQSLDEQRQILNERKSEYMSQLEKCKQQENLVEDLRRPLDDLKKETQAEFDQVNPVYFAACSAMKCLNYNSVLIVQTYPAPPISVCKIIDLICLLLDIPKSKVHGGTQGEFFKELQFFDKDHISEKNYKLLGEALKDEDLQMERVQSSSAEAAELCQWLHNIYNYATICRKMNPKLGKLLAQEEKVNRAQSDLGRKRMKAEAIKQNLEALVQEHRESIKKLKEMEKEMQITERRLKEADTIKNHLQLYEADWRELLETSKMRLKTVQADALLCAIVVIYFSLQSQADRVETVGRLKSQFSPQVPDGGDNETADIYAEYRARFYLRSPFDFKEIILSALFKDGKLGAPIESEQMAWNIIILRSLLLSENQKWPLVYDPSDRFKEFYSTILPGEEEIKQEEQYPSSGDHEDYPTSAEVKAVPQMLEIDCRSDDFEELLLEHCQKASVLLLTSIEYEQSLSSAVRAILAHELRCDTESSKSFDLGNGNHIPCHPDFRIIIFLKLHPMQSYPGSHFLQKSKLSLIDNTLGQEDVSRIVFKRLTELERPEYESQVASLIKDRFTGQLSLFRERELVLSAVSHSSVNLIDRPTIIHTLKTCHDNILRQEEILNENQVMFQQLKTKILPLRCVVDNILNIMATLRDMRKISNLHFCDTLDFILEIFRNFQRVVRFPGLVGSIAARCQELIDFTTREALEYINRVMTESQILIFVAIYSLRRMKQDGAITDEEMKCFLSRETANDAIKGSIPATDYFTTEHLNLTKHLEENVPAFSGITQSFINHGQQWHQYFQLPFSMTSPTPEYYKFHHLSNFHKALLWKQIVPNKTKEIIAELTKECIGANIPLNRQFSIKRMLSMTNASSPVVFHIPQWSYDWSISEGNSLVYILDDIIQLASMENPYCMTALNFGQRDVWDLINGSLRTTAENGGWLILQNMHLLSDWDDAFLREMELVFADKKAIHPKFRLFVTTESMTKPIPVILQRLGTKFVCDMTSNDEEALEEMASLTEHIKPKLCTTSKSFSSTEREVQKLIICIGCVHVVLCHQRFAGSFTFANNYPWKFADFASILSSWQMIGGSHQCDDKVIKLLTKEAYLSHTLEVEDRRYANRLIDAVWDCAMDSDILQSSHSLCEAIYEKITSAIVRRDEGLLCRDLITKLASSSLVDKISNSLTLSDRSSTEYDLAERLRCRLEDFLNELDTVTDKPKSDNGRSELSLEQFIQKEEADLQQSLQDLLRRLQHVCAALGGFTSSSDVASSYAAAFKLDCLPQDWLEFHHTNEIDCWFDALRARTVFLNEWAKERTQEINFLHFKNPRKFLQVLLKCSAKEQRRDLRNMHILVSVDPGKQGFSYPLSGFIVRGAFWDPNARQLLPSVWDTLSRVPRLFLTIVTAKVDHLPPRTKCNFVKNHVLFGGDSIQNSDIALEIELPARETFTRTPLVTQII